ncbi:hypothetical protein CC78DRAFT_573454 [Lojkania enalia]|uniref:Uncharacterized protein n=1 Tax=Lojkania enalia TaxID=147567 RepID=A0A9P4NDF4_9PLEO|nr:hypothetical protein CC78DRAFT_573454 [Didymosphaeria enalia]
MPDSPGPTIQQTSPRTPANVGIRVHRSQYSRTLLGSPARPGHSHCLKEIFQNSLSVENKMPQSDDTVSYPSLPNISRALASVGPMQEDEHHVYFNVPNYEQDSETAANISGPAAPAGQRLPYHMESNAPQPTTGSPMNSSASWSGDSSYLTIDLLPRVSTPVSSSQPRINDWLSSISFASDPSDNSFAAEPVITSEPYLDCYSPQHVLPDAQKNCNAQLEDQDYISDKFCSANSNRATTPSSGMRSPISYTAATWTSPTALDKRGPVLSLAPGRSKSSFGDQGNSPNVTPRDTNSSRQIGGTVAPKEIQDLNDGDNKLSPLSPNVCIERGPSRYHSARKTPEARWATTNRFRSAPLQPKPSSPGYPTMSVEEIDITPQSARTLRALSNAGKRATCTKIPSQNKESKSSHLADESRGVKL